MDFIVLSIIVVVLGLAIYKIVRDKKSGSKCGSCPYANVCAISNNISEKTQCEITDKEDNLLVEKG